jgi:thymidylate kinase
LIVHLIQELSVPSEVDVVISDRALLDHWAYSSYLFSEELSRAGVLQLYEQFVMGHCANYDILFFLPIEFDVADDGTREDDKNFQYEIEKYILDLISKYKLPVLVVSGSVEDRQRLCVDAILAKLSLPDHTNMEVGHA